MNAAQFLEPTAEEEDAMQELMKKRRTAADVLHEMAGTYEERNKVYGDNFLTVGKVLAAMFPNGVTLRTADDFNRWHLFELKIVKLTRFANSGLLHLDSIHDDSVYGAMLEAITNDKSSFLGAK